MFWLSPRALFIILNKARGDQKAGLSSLWPQCLFSIIKGGRGVFPLPPTWKYQFREVRLLRNPLYSGVRNLGPSKTQFLGLHIRMLMFAYVIQACVGP